MFYVYTKRVKNRITKQIANQKRPKSGGFEAYDDIDIPSDLGGKGIYDTYDVVADENIRYADTRHLTEDDYIEMLHNSEKRLQSSDDYECIPTSEPTYLQMTPIPTPRTSLEAINK